VVAANFLIDAESNLKAALSGLTAAPAQAAKGSVSHQASGTLEAIDAKNGTVTVTHGPVASLAWPAMTMDFILANPGWWTSSRPARRWTSNSSSAGRANG
jgi:Cu(I)/Ag(I) efflux system membrane fusion protein